MSPSKAADRSSEVFLQIDISDDAIDLARKKGGRIALDFITPVG
ncbi:MAG: hypothetical protein BMS9Abin07_0126 [Acidimicrobiia bacterium]|nr:MAG: hypothetical protein BMS9Abin07_0126 [Acidimicrobiia bacterium]